MEAGSSVRRFPNGKWWVLWQKGRRECEGRVMDRIIETDEKPESKRER